MGRNEDGSRERLDTNITSEEESTALLAFRNPIVFLKKAIHLECKNSNIIKYKVRETNVSQDTPWVFGNILGEKFLRRKYLLRLWAYVLLRVVSNWAVGSIFCEVVSIWTVGLYLV